ncbi:hypothetical protein HPP92_000551 [Vanilla planifolia]|uniref:RING-type E3 ubiquitin transferase n=1 Tax=Vanilla planifolia TaxID=51239 RepID=A0A835RYB4_VANPL|nr:hypothetical protein HPP92_000551 [Vanilla planifolia]
MEERQHDQNFINSMLEEIASSAGVNIETSEIKKEFESLCKEKEEAAASHERPIETYLNQVIELLSHADAIKQNIELLSHADAPRDQEKIKKLYELIKTAVEKSEITDGEILKYNAFICPITKTVMVDPVNLSTGTTCERAEIEAMFEGGCKEDPRTGQPLEDLTLTPNSFVRELTQQWREQNCFLKIIQAKKILQSGDHSAVCNALCDLENVIKESQFAKDWIALEGLIDIIVPLLGRLDNILKLRTLQTLLTIVERHSDNKEKVVAAQGFHYIIKCLGLDSNLSGAAIHLLFELLHVNDGWHQSMAQKNCTWNEALCRKFKEQGNAIAFLVIIVLDKQYQESAKKAEDILLQLCIDDDKTISLVASFHWFKPLAWRLSHGLESSKQTMMQTLEQMQLVDEDIKQLGEAGVIKPLVEMASRGADSDKLAFVILAKLSDSYENRRLIVEAGAFPLILKQISSALVSSVVKEKCSEIFEKLTCDSEEFLSNVGHAVPEVEPIINSLVAELKNPNTCLTIRKTVFRALLNICKHERVAAEKAIATTDGISSILPLLDDSEQEIRQLALQLIHQFSTKVPVAIADLLLLHGNMLKTLLSLLGDDNQPQLQVIAAGLLANLQKSTMKLTNRLAELGTIPVLLKLLDQGSNEAKEYVLDSLIGFLNPANIDMQKSVVNAGAYPLLVNTLKSESLTARAKAAELIGNLSSNSPKLTAMPKASCLSFCFAKQAPTCEVHGGICGVESSFCLLQVDALPDLVRLLRERDEAVNQASLHAMKTLAQEGLTLRSAKVFHRYGAIEQMLVVLERLETNLAIKEELVELLDKSFDDHEVATKYSVQAWEILERLTAFDGNRNDGLREKAAKLIAKLQRYSKPGSMPSF